jgi:uncharacterized membrane protein HdeD (DUF308 family)
MSWRVYQRICEIIAVLMMMAGIVLMWMKLDSKHALVYAGFILLATGKLIETLNVSDPNFKIVKVIMCLSIYTLVLLNFFYQVRSIVYILVPLGVYYGLHYRLLFHQRRI